MKCGSCEKKCLQEHCAFNYSFTEACESAKPFRSIDGGPVLICKTVNGIRSVKEFSSGESYELCAQDYFKEYTLDI
jgi:hypothetical protein